MAWETRFVFHARLANLILNDWAEERHRIADNDPDRESKIEENKRGCAEELKQLNRFFFGAKQAWNCRECPFVDYWMETEGDEMPERTAYRKRGRKRGNGT